MNNMIANDKNKDLMCTLDKGKIDKINNGGEIGMSEQELEEVFSFFALFNFEEKFPDHDEDKYVIKTQGEACLINYKTKSNRDLFYIASKGKIDKFVSYFGLGNLLYGTNLQSLEIRTIKNYLKDSVVTKDRKSTIFLTIGTSDLNDEVILPVKIKLEFNSDFKTNTSTGRMVFNAPMLNKPYVIEMLDGGIVSK